MKFQIDIENYENLTPEEKIAALEANYHSVAQIKASADKAASEAASYKKQLREKQTDDEIKAAEREAKFAEVMAEVEALRHEKLVGTYTTSYMAMGYEEKLAKATAEAMAKGDTETVFKNQRLHLENREKALRTELLKQTPPPAGGGTDAAMKKADFMKMSLAEKQKFAIENPEQYKAFYAE
jgi:hypothetical protein